MIAHCSTNGLAAAGVRRLDSRVARSPGLLYGWMTTRNRAFDNRTPVEVIKDEGFAGLLMVRGHLDRARGR